MRCSIDAQQPNTHAALTPTLTSTRLEGIIEIKKEAEASF